MRHLRSLYENAQTGPEYFGKNNIYTQSQNSQQKETRPGKKREDVFKMVTTWGLQLVTSGQEEFPLAPLY